MSTPLTGGPLSALYDVIEFLNQLRETEETRVWGRIIEKLSVALDCEAGTYYGYLPQKLQIVPRYALGKKAEDLKGTPVDIRTGLSGWAALHREPLLVEDAYEDERFFSDTDKVTGFRTRSVLVVPLMDRLDLVGVIQLLNKRGNPFNEADLRFTEAVCRLAIAAIRSLRLESAMDKVAARNASILENLGGGFIAVDGHGKLILCNPAARRILSLGEKANLAAPVEQALWTFPKMAELLLDTLATRRTVKRQEISWSFRGETRTLGYSTLLIQDPQGEITGAGITFQDITQVKKQETP